MIAKSRQKAGPSPCPKQGPQFSPLPAQEARFFLLGPWTFGKIDGAPDTAYLGHLMKVLVSGIRLCVSDEWCEEQQLCENGGDVNKCLLAALRAPASPRRRV